MSGQYTANILGMGSALPQRILSNKDLEKIVETSDEWIVTRTGIKERRIASDEEHTSTLGIRAAKEALEQSGLSAKDIDAVFVATLTPDYLTPSTAAIIQSEMGMNQAFAFDIQAACSGFIYTLSVAKAYITSGMAKNILVIGSEKLSSFVDYEDRRTCVLFGDGAGAAIVSREERGLEILDVSLGADGDQADLLKIPGGGCRAPSSADSIEKRLHYLQMNGKEVFKHAVRRMEAAAVNCLDNLNITTEDLKWFIPHQANERIIDAIAKRLKFPQEKIYKTVHKYGNTSASSVPIALHELLKESPLSSGEYALLVAFGAGLTFGASVLRQR
jgi:3-oxoacyl-[acyl-carrier-protein] synthase III